MIKDREVYYVDYLEGLLLGVQWSDTDFENRRHVSSLVLYSILVNAVIILNYFTGKFPYLFSGDFTIRLVFYLILFFGCPFICFRYYRFPIWAKIAVLLVQTVKQLILTVLLLSWVRPKLTLPSEELKDTLIDYLNNTLATQTQHFEESAGTFATVIGVIFGGVYVVFVFLAVVVLALIVPALFIFFMRLIQLGYDKLIAKFILADHIDR